MFLELSTLMLMQCQHEISVYESSLVFAEQMWQIANRQSFKFITVLQ